MSKKQSNPPPPHNSRPSPPPASPDGITKSVVTRRTTDREKRDQLTTDICSLITMYNKDTGLCVTAVDVDYVFNRTIGGEVDVVDCEVSVDVVLL